MSEGLSQTIVFSITQDENGYIWVGTEDGLNRYDGYEFKILRNKPDDGNSLSGNNISRIFEDSKGNLWIGTYGNGLNILNHETGKITRYARKQYGNLAVGSKGEGFNGLLVICIYEDSKGIIWVGTHSGLNRYDPATGEFGYFQHAKDDPTSAPIGKLRSIIEDKQGNLWVASQRVGLTKFNHETEEFTYYSFDENDPDGISSDKIITMLLDRKENLWVGTYGGGLNRANLATLDPNAETIKFEHFRHDPNDPFSLSRDWIAAIHEDPQGHIWIGTHNGGLNKLDVSTGRFYRYEHNLQSRNSLADNTVYEIYEDDFGVLWFGTRQGISKYEHPADKFLAYRHNPHDETSISSNGIGSIVTGDDGSVWLATSGEGLNRLDLSTGISKRYLNEPGNPGSLHSDNIGALAKDSLGRIWIGSDETGLCHYDPKEDVFVTLANYELSCEGCLVGNRVKTMFVDADDNIWLGTMKGILRLDHGSDTLNRLSETLENDEDAHFCEHAPSSFYQTTDGVIYIGLSKAGFGRYDTVDKAFEHFKSNMEDSTSLPNEHVRCIMEAKDGALWIGSMGGGLIKYDRNNGSFRTWRMPDESRSSLEQKDGLPNDIVYGILEDDHGNLWMSTNNGISKFNPKDETFRNYDKADGLQSNEFSSYSYHRASNGLMFFGGINGFNVFHPDSILDIQTLPHMVINKFSVFNQEVIPGEGEKPRLTKPINYTDTLFLSYKDYVFSFEFAALHYVIPQKNQYAYKMEGFEEDWNYVGIRRFATYTNLDPGEYTFRVKGSNCDGIWNEEGKSIYIIISPPFWKTWWFKTLSLLAIIATVVLYIRIRETRLKHQRKILKEQVQIQTKQLRKQTEELEETNKDI
ncbi:MAG: hypothetical protein JKX73_02315, partial [Flavobacteriales bacterium]|nr:hypothetical protein [Flavobacteriales bacterium]